MCRPVGSGGRSTVTGSPVARARTWCTTPLRWASSSSEVRDRRAKTSPGGATAGFRLNAPCHYAVRSPPPPSGAACAAASRAIGTR